ncbi:DUF664 domain-containing protein [Streptococcus chenjunshii]|uniref:DUF664 domain-containing protein n=1 Tax=Streptococcus chenjunshii TaxID=2173853 RepID=A0A372KM27_9STRE|nr:DUF664 domain-containing protein [Streptococcus chenjunshii]AXQ79115.1 DUF664 domain-containing protein [Streptococcus chenjunshii]RFU50309.1 DUF664 domain-containing protein [Streptococcus chenjunshii]RFU53340.1 DUF664 domain-containing protein [Streptococcus chenjunshii]
MSYLDMLIESVDRAVERFERLFEGVDTDQANAFPAQEVSAQLKSMTWLAWHTAREMDLQIADLAHLEPIWFSQAWKEKFSLDLPDDTPDWKHTLEEAQRVQVDDLGLVLDYLKAAAEFTKDYLKSLNEDSLDDVIDESWTPAVTRGARLVSIIDDAAMHSGQVIYARRLLGLKD